MSAIKSVKCACITRWVVDFCDDRGRQPVSSLVAAMASGVGLPVYLESVGDTPLRPVIIEGAQYGKSKDYVAEVCKTCGWPILVYREELASKGKD